MGGTFEAVKHKNSLLGDLCDPLLWLTLAVAAFLIFYNLGERPLWEDEAETACLAVNVLKFGKPLAFDGVNLISQEESREFGPDFIWRWSPWLQIYGVAAGLALFGQNAFAARLPFALASLASLALLYLFMRRKMGSLAWARAATAVLTFTVIFLMFARQARYYGLGIFLTLAVLYFFFSNWQTRKGPLIGLTLCLGLLFHANYLLFLSFAPALLASALIFYPEKTPLKRSGLVVFLTFLLTLPGVFIYGMGKQGGMLNFSRIPDNLRNYFADLLMFMLPLPLVGWLLWRLKRYFVNRAQIDGQERFVLFLSLLILLNILIMVLIPQQFHRYIVHLYPACAIILAYAGLKLLRLGRALGALYFALLLFTNWLFIAPMELTFLVNRPWHNDFMMLTWPNFPLKLHLSELFCGYKDINAATIEYLAPRVGPGESVLVVDYGDLPLQFHTPYKLMGGLGDAALPNLKPDWIVLKGHVRVTRDERLMYGRVFMRESLDLERDYERLDTDIPDESFGNIADPYWHHYIPLSGEYPRVVVYHKKPGVK